MQPEQPEQLELGIEVPQRPDSESLAMTSRDWAKFQAIRFFAPGKIPTVFQLLPEPNFEPEPEWDGTWFNSFWVQWTPVIAVVHPVSGWTIIFQCDYSELTEIADFIEITLQLP
ncbi:hypothetical protein [Okeania sp. SIO1I7]|uniref:hypothetical protein n=1 Tax=Okeania sp. SIO1I7 TaxID=2607772 RepID=UPI0013FA875C|nr:hypothetical protein [Okeania sp. SIO1I7]NET29518.1 hypothetical protein [Okeania sp. SIO1I7]